MNDIANYFSINKDAFISFGILLTFLISTFSLIMSIRNNKAVHYVNSITKTRIEWIQNLRDTIAEFISKTNIHNNAYYKNNYDKMGVHLSDCQKLCSKVKLLLNCCDQKDKELIELCNLILESYREYCDEVHGCKINDKGYFIETSNMKKYKGIVSSKIEELSDKVQIYLKSEWNRVKYESMGKIYESATQEFDYEELYKMFEQPSYKKQVWKRACINLKAKFKRIFFSPRVLLILLVIFVVIILIQLI